MTRLAYLDWLRGVAVLIMVEAHTFDAWTRLDERGHLGYRLAIGVGGFGAPLFLFLAGVALALGAAARMQRGRSADEVAALARRRGWQIFGLAFLFRLQSWLISGGDWTRTLLKVDILNIMGLSMLAAAVLWGWGRNRLSRSLLLAGAGILVVMATPVVRATPVLAGLPDQVEWYLRESPGVTSFAIFPWAAFLFAGSVVGLLLQGAQTELDQRRANGGLAAAGAGMLVAAAAALLLGYGAGAPAWEDAPASFFLRLGVVLACVPVAYAWTSWFPSRSWIRELGVASLFVYWIHVEMVYGVVAIPLHRQLTFPGAILGLVLLTALLYGLVRLKERIRPGRTSERNQVRHLRDHGPGEQIA